MSSKLYDMSPPCKTQTFGKGGTRFSRRLLFAKHARLLFLARALTYNYLRLETPSLALGSPPQRRPPFKKMFGELTTLCFAVECE